MGNLYVVATPIGNLQDISFRALETLKAVDFILCEDTRHSLKLLNFYDIKKPLYAYHKFNEESKALSYLETIKKGKNAALITDAGTPCISDPGSIIVNKAWKQGIKVIGVGGISALTTALSISGFDLKHFIFYGFFPRENKDKKELLSFIKQNAVDTFVFYESPKRISASLRYLYENLGNLKISLFSDLTKIHEQAYVGTLEEVLEKLEANPKKELGEYTFIIRKDFILKDESDFKLSLEAQLVELCVTKNITLKEAVNLLASILSSDRQVSKKDIYNASLNLKKFL